MNNTIIYELNMQLNMLKNNNNLNNNTKVDNKYKQINDLQRDIEKYKE